MNIYNAKLPTVFNQWSIKQGDLVVRKGKHEAKVYFVEAVDVDSRDNRVTSVLLVNGIKDEFYSYEDGTIDWFFDQYRLLAKKEYLIEPELSQEQER